jgi:hypothetical protein
MEYMSVRYEKSGIYINLLVTYTVNICFIHLSVSRNEIPSFILMKCTKLFFQKKKSEQNE